MAVFYKVLSLAFIIIVCFSWPTDGKPRGPKPKNPFKGLGGLGGADVKPKANDPGLENTDKPLEEEDVPDSAN